jgi:hypothetical protein
LDAKEKSARFVVGIGTTIDDDTVAWMKRGEHFFKLDPVGSSPCYFSRERATLFSKASMNELLMIDAMEPAGKKSSAECHFQSVFIFLGGWGGEIG